MRKANTAVAIAHHADGGASNHQGADRTTQLQLGNRVGRVRIPDSKCIRWIHQAVTNAAAADSQPSCVHVTSCIPMTRQRTSRAAVRGTMTQAAGWLD